MRLRNFGDARTDIMMYLSVVIFTLISIVVVIGLFDYPLLKAPFHYLYDWIKGRVKGLNNLQGKGWKQGFKRYGLRQSPDLTTDHKPRKSSRLQLDWGKKISRWPLVPTVTTLLIMLTAGGCYLLSQHSALEVYHAQETSAATINPQVTQLLKGERLRPPPAPPAALFAELEAEIASYQAAQVGDAYLGEGSWPAATTATIIHGPPMNGALTDDSYTDAPLVTRGPGLTPFTSPVKSSGHSGDMLAVHLSSGYINIKNADRNWNKMNSEFVQRMLTVYKIMRDQYGYEMVLLEGYRSPQRQARLLKKGTNVTKAGSYKSYHQFGLAGDSAFIRNGKIVISERDPWAMRGYQLYGKVAKSAGLVWGGDWRMQDLGHVELRKKGVLGRPKMAEILTKQ